jgi:hypothetical protein
VTPLRGFGHHRRVPSTCEACGHRSDSIPAHDNVLRCPQCGSERPFVRKPLLIVTGAAGTGKSTICARLAGTIPHAVLLDLDVFVDEIASAASPDPDYGAFWRLMMRMAHELSENDLVVVYFSVMLPEQVLLNSDALRYFDGVEFLCLTCSPELLLTRLNTRGGWGAATADELSARVEFWQDFDLALIAAAGDIPTATVLDSGGAVDRVTSDVLHWIEDRLPSTR